MASQLYGERWKIIENIGEGGQGQVFRVEDTKDGNDNYVLKRLKNTKRIKRFKNEIDSIKELEHPNIVKIIDTNLEAAKPYFVTDYCSGGELTFEKISSFSIIEKLSLFSTICKAVGFSHLKGIIHRDIKPANILFKEDNRTPVITDFGICFNTDDGFERLTETIEQVGARYFMAPELADGRTKDVTAKADVYSLGKLLYWMFKGKVMARENFAEREWDLRKYDSFNHSFHFIHEIFEKTIVAEPLKNNWSKEDNRFSDANDLSKQIDELIDVLENDGRYLDSSLPQKCIFCKNGKYKLYAIPSEYKTHRMTNLSGGFPNYPEGSEDPNSFCYVCNNCGNVQFFNKSMINGKSWNMNTGIPFPTI